MAMVKEMHNNGHMLGESMDVPGFRFYPTEEELLGFYLKKRVQCGHPLSFDILIPTLDLYRYDPWELPGLAHVAGVRQWFFFVQRDLGKSCPRPNRLTVSGFWKATGSDKQVRNKLLHCIGLKKTLVFYRGKAPCGLKTEWIMNEYKLSGVSSCTAKKKMDMVLCRIYRKAASYKSMEQRTRLPDYIEKEELGFSVGDKYEGNLYNSFSLNGGCQLSDQMRETKVSSLTNQKREGVYSSVLSKPSNEDTVFESPEPIMFSEETMVSKTPKASKPPNLELPKLSMDRLFSHETIVIPWADNINEWTPSAFLSTP